VALRTVYRIFVIHRARKFTELSMCLETPAIDAGSAVVSRGKPVSLFQSF